MKEKANIFIHNFMNPIIAGVYIIFLYQLYIFQHNQRIDYFDSNINLLINLFLLGFVLVVWFLTCIVLSFQNYRMKVTRFKKRYIQVIGGIIILVGSMFYGYTTVKENKSSNHIFSEYRGSDINDIDFQKEGILKIYNQIQNDLPENIIAHVQPQTYFLCDKKGNMKSFEFVVYYEVSNRPYILAYEYSKDKIYVSSYEGNYDGENSLYPTLDSFIDHIQSITLPKTSYKITMVSDDQRDTEMVYYPLNMNTYLKVESYKTP